MDAREQVNQLLKESGATLRRNHKHEVWTLPNGQKFTRSMTPSDTNSDKNNLTDLKRALGITKTVATVGERRVRRPKTRTVELKTKYDAPVNSDLANKLRTCGVTETALRDEIARLQASIDSCWWHQLVAVVRALFK